MPIKFPLLGGGSWFFFGRGGWKCRFYFYGRGDFSDFTESPETDRERKTLTNSSFAGILNTPGVPGHPGKLPGTSQLPSLETPIDAVFLSIFSFLFSNLEDVHDPGPRPQAPGPRPQTPDPRPQTPDPTQTPQTQT